MLGIIALAILIRKNWQRRKRAGSTWQSERQSFQASLQTDPNSMTSRSRLPEQAKTR